MYIDTRQARQNPSENLSTIDAYACLKRNPNGTHIFSVQTVMGSWFNSWLLFICTEAGRVENISNGFPSTVYEGVRRWARYVISANYLLRYFYIQYIRERRLAGTSSNPLGHTGSPSWEWWNIMSAPIEGLLPRL